MSGRSSRTEAPAPKFSLAVQYASEADWLPTRAQFRRWVRAAVRCDLKMTLRIVDEEEGRTLNYSFRNKNYATNVLTFIYDDEGMLSGDIAICAPVVEREAREQHKTLPEHYAHLVVHGVLHLQGYDHERKKDAEKMEALETAIVMKLGYPDPYREQ